MDRKDILLNKQRIVIKVGTSTITYEETGNINLEKLEKFVRILINLRNKGKRSDRCLIRCSRSWEKMPWEWTGVLRRSLKNRHVRQSVRGS